jgi:hypothetical protein
MNEGPGLMLPKTKTPRMLNSETTGSNTDS